MVYRRILPTVRWSRFGCGRSRSEKLASVFMGQPLADMDRTGGARACYLHACLCSVTRKRMTNTSVRQRFGIESGNKAIASRLLREALESGMIRLETEEVADKLRAYVPFWA